MNPASGISNYPHYDQVGSLRAITDTTGNVVKQIDYDSFGNVTYDSNPAFAVSFGFAGGLYDYDTGLTRFGFRDYDPAIGRWTAKDPIDFAGGDVNLFQYSQADPVNLIDSLGLYPGQGFDTPDEAAYDAVDWILRNKSPNIEWSGWIYYRESDCKYTYDSPLPGDNERSYLPKPLEKDKIWVHTHTQWQYPHFSRTGPDNDISRGIRWERSGYVGHPFGFIKKFDYPNNRVIDVRSGGI